MVIPREDTGISSESDWPGSLGHGGESAGEPGAETLLGIQGSPYTRQHHPLATLHTPRVLSHVR